MKAGEATEMEKSDTWSDTSQVSFRVSSSGFHSPLFLRHNKKHVRRSVSVIQR